MAGSRAAHDSSALKILIDPRRTLLGAPTSGECEHCVMGIVDPADDTVQRFVVLHYRFDPARRQRTDVIVAAFDGESEFLQDLERRQRQLRDQQAAGLADAAERISGVVKEAGYDARQDARRAEWKRFNFKKHRARKRGRA